jgi:ABC-type transporter Mla maintaining outer membrane lipid asymmetry ATPase subunit MlaF
VSTTLGGHSIHRDLSLSVARGEVIALIGGSGTGKSVLLREIIGLLKPQAGHIELFGQSVWDSTPEQMNVLRQRFGVLFQDGALFSSLNVEDNVATPLFEHTDLPHGTCRQLARLKLALAGLPPDAGEEAAERTFRRHAQAGGAGARAGARSRAAVPRRTDFRPRSDFRARIRFADPLLADSLGLTVFLVTHDLDTLFSIIDRVIVLSNGRVLGSGTVAELKHIDDPWLRDYFAARSSEEKCRMETEGRYTLVGTLVLAVIALMTAAILWLAGVADHIAYQTYSIYFKQQSLDGLAVGSPVKMRGIKVGVVDGYRFAKGGDECRQRHRAHRRGRAGACRRRGLHQAQPGHRHRIGRNQQWPEPSPLLDTAPKGERYPVIAEGSSDIDKVATAVSAAGGKRRAGVERMNTLLSDENQRAISQTLANLNELSGHLAANKQSLDAVVQGIRDASDEFRFAGASISQAATRAEGSIVGVGNNASDALKEARTRWKTAARSQPDFAAHPAAHRNRHAGDDQHQSRRAYQHRCPHHGGQRLSEPRAILFGPGQTAARPRRKIAMRKPRFVLAHC